MMGPAPLRMLLALAVVVLVAPAVTGLENGLSRTPHRGWTTWNKFRCNVGHNASVTPLGEELLPLNERTVLEIAAAIQTTGLAAAGYELINLDDCYLNKTRQNGRLIGGPTFPSGMKALGDKLHAMSLKLGVYLDSGLKTCDGFPGSAGFEAVDAQTIADWGADYIKYDSCSQVHPEDELFRYFTMRDALNATGRPMIYTICPGQGACNGAPGEDYANQWMPADEGLLRGDYWAAGSVANAKMCRGDHFDSCASSHRAKNATTPCSNFCGQKGCAQSANTRENRRLGATSGDIAPNWCSFNCLVDANIAYDSGSTSGPGHWTLSDALEVGMGMSVAEDESHFTLWCLMSWPLIIGHDVRNQTADTLRILTNPELLSISADPMGRAAKLVGGTRAITAPTQIYLRQLVDGDFVAALYNRDDSEALAITLHWGSMWMPTVQPMAVRDLWQHREVGVWTHNFTATVSPHGVKVFRFRQQAWRPPNRTHH